MHHLVETNKMVDYILTLYENYTLKQSATKRNQLVSKTTHLHQPETALPNRSVPQANTLVINHMSFVPRGTEVRFT
jgi:hypothetical protein